MNINHAHLWRCIPVAATGTWGIYLLINDADSIMVFDFIPYLLAGFTGFLVFTWAVYKSIRTYRATRAAISFLPVVTGLLFIAGLWGVNYVLQQRDKSPVVLQAGYDGGFNGCWFEFREDGSYKFGNGSGLGVDFYRGAWQVHDSIITIDPKVIGNIRFSGRFVIRKTGPTGESCLYQVDSSGNIVDKGFVFNVHEDHRTTGAQQYN